MYNSEQSEKIMFRMYERGQYNKVAHNGDMSVYDIKEPTLVNIVGILMKKGILVN